VPLRTTLYGYLFLATQPLLWILYVLVILELFQVVLAAHAGITSFSRKVVSWALAVAAAISLATLLFDLQDRNPGPQYVILSYFYLLDRVVHSTLLLFLVLLTGFLAYFPVPLHRNARVHAAIFSFYFLSKTAVLLARNLLGATIGDQANLWMRVVAIACLTGWAALFSEAGEMRLVRSNWASHPKDEEKLMAQLDAINRTLLGSAKE
jgi:hypothetical protein